MRSRLSTLLGVAMAAVVVAGGLVPGDARAEEIRYVNLGDSYSAGSGVLPPAPGSSLLCLQANDNFAHLLARKNRYRLTDVSCGGATTDDFFTSQNSDVKPQLRALNRNVDVVTFSIGGNDENVFAGTVMKCVIAGVKAGMKGSPCEDQNSTAVLKTIRDKTFPKLVRAMSAVRAAAPNAKVLALNYPWIAPDSNTVCPGMPVAPADGKFTHRVQVELNDAIARAAAQTGVTLVDVAAASAGHDACKPVGVRWVEPLLTTVQPVPVHPNALGERKMAEVAARVLKG